MLVRKIVRGLVVSPVDKNVKDRLLECPALYWEGYKTTFWNNHYRVQPGLTEDLVLSRWCAFYRRRGYEKYVKLSRVGHKVPGVAYTMVKMKDLDPASPHYLHPRRRPLTPYGGKGRQRHPLWKLMKICGAILKKAVVSAGLRCWNLDRCSDFASSLPVTWKRLYDVGDDQCGVRVVAFPFDIKSMFTELDKQEVMRAARFVLTENPGWKSPSQRLGKVGFYPVGAFISSLDGKWNVRIGKGLRQRKHELFIPFRVVLDIIEFDLRESLMTCGKYIVTQCFGIPMGSFLSALLAGLTVSVAEHKFYSNLPPSVATRVDGLRYADDGLVLVVEWDGVESADSIFQRFVDGCYPPPLELEVEQHTGMFHFLECTVYLGVKSAWALHRLKNWEEWTRSGRLQYRVWTGKGSWSASARGTLIGTLVRASRNCSRLPHMWTGVVVAMLRVLVDAQVAGGYSIRSFRNILSMLAVSKVDDGLWKLLHRLTRRVQCFEELYNFFSSEMLEAAYSASRIMPSI